MFPTDYKEWRYCIEVKCGIKLTRTFTKLRVESLMNASDKETKNFRKLYGDEYLNQVLAWFQRAHKEANN